MDKRGGEKVGQARIIFETSPTTLYRQRKHTDIREKRRILILKILCTCKSEKHLTYRMIYLQFERLTLVTYKPMLELGLAIKIVLS